VTFTQRDAPNVIAETLANEKLADETSASTSAKLRQLLTIFTMFAAVASVFISM
jgi:hypothetical protein